MTRDALSEALARRLDRIRGYRVRPPRMRGVEADFADMARGIKRLHKRLGAVGEAWTQCCPPDLAARSTIRGFARGTLTVAVDDSATRFELDRWLRAGGEDDLIRASRAPIHRVKVIVVAPCARAR